MTLIASIHGRLGSDPKTSTTQAGKEMTRANVAVDVTGHDGEDQTLWVSILAFGKVAETLARAAKGVGCSAMDRMTRGIYAPPRGEPR
jgi:single-stranded DNA-binding protein